MTDSPGQEPLRRVAQSNTPPASSARSSSGRRHEAVVAITPSGPVPPFALPDDSDPALPLRQALRQVPFVLFIAFLVTAVAIITSLFQDQRYRASADVLYSPLTPAASGDTTIRDLETLVNVVETSRVIDADVAASVGLTVDELEDSISTVASDEANLLTVTASTHGAATAAAAANAVAAALIEWRQAAEQAVARGRVELLREQLTLLESTVPKDPAVIADLRAQLSAAEAQLDAPSAELAIVDPAEPPEEPYAPNLYLNGGLGFLAGLVLGIIGAVVRQRLDRRLRAVEDVEQIYGVPTLGVVPHVGAAARGDRSAAIGDFKGTSPVAEAFRAIRTNLSLFSLDGPSSKVLVVTSAVAQEGKSGASANLALALATSGKHVLVVSGDVQRPSLHEYFRRFTVGRTPQPGNDDRLVTAQAQNYGLIDVLAGDVALNEAARRVELDWLDAAGSLHLLANAKTFHDPGALYQSRAMRKLLDEMLEAYDVVVIDSPPLLGGGAASVLARLADSVVLVARLNHLTRDSGRRAVRLMAAAQVVALGTIITGRITDDTAYLYDGRSYPQT
jgi:receptor protein-tyrosine kinase